MSREEVDSINGKTKVWIGVSSRRKIWTAKDPSTAAKEVIEIQTNPKDIV